jgi:hypothetical protein
VSYVAQSAFVSAGGSGYVVGDILTVSGGTLTQAAQFQVTAVLAGVITAVIPYLAGSYTTLPPNPNGVTGGTGTGAALVITWTAIAPSGPATPRTTPALVGGIVQVTAGVDVTPYIYAANMLTTNLCTYPKPGGSPNQIPYSDGFINSQMELIERWLSAHLYSINSNQLSQAKAGSVAVGFQYKVDLNLSATMYGQQAMLLDQQGALAAWNNTTKTKRQITITMKSLAKSPCWPGDIDDWASMTLVE